MVAFRPVHFSLTADLASVISRRPPALSAQVDALVSETFEKNAAVILRNPAALVLTQHDLERITSCKSGSTSQMQDGS